MYTNLYVLKGYEYLGSFSDTLYAARMGYLIRRMHLYEITRMGLDPVYWVDILPNEHDSLNYCKFYVGKKFGSQLVERETWLQEAWSVREVALTPQNAFSECIGYVRSHTEICSYNPSKRDSKMTIEHLLKLELSRVVDIPTSIMFDLTAHCIICLNSDNPTMFCHSKAKGLGAVFTQEQLIDFHKFLTHAFISFIYEGSKPLGCVISSRSAEFHCIDLDLTHALLSKRKCEKLKPEFSIVITDAGELSSKHNWEIRTPRGLPTLYNDILDCPVFCFLNDKGEEKFFRTLKEFLLNKDNYASSECVTQDTKIFWEDVGAFVDHVELEGNSGVQI